jgi:hypothetical protein
MRRPEIGAGGQPRHGSRTAAAAEPHEGDRSYGDSEDSGEGEREQPAPPRALLRLGDEGVDPER